MGIIHSLLQFFPDKMYIQLIYFKHFGKFVDFKSPKTFNEKIQWLKLYDRKPLYTTMVDKIEVKKYVANIIGEEYIIPTLGTWDDPSEIDFDAFPNQFVLKWNHDSGSVIICKDKSEFDRNAAIQKLKRYRKHNGYIYGREWPYKNVKPRILAEKYMVDRVEGHDDLPDYKVHCFNGIPKVILDYKDLFNAVGMTEDFFSAEWKHLDVKRPNQDTSVEKIARPEELSEMLRLAEELSKNLPFARTDFYTVGGNLYFGEITLYPASGLKRLDTEQYDYIFGDWTKLKIPGGYILTKPGMMFCLHSELGYQNECLSDYKFMCFNGTVRCSFVCTDRFSKEGLKVTFFDEKWELMPFERHYPRSNKPIPKPDNYEQMVEMAEKLSKDIPFVRVDFYEVQGKVYFGELTFHPGSGLEEFTPDEWDNTLGSWIVLSQSR